MPNISSNRIMSELSLGLDWAAKRHHTIANNLANIDTPRYKRQDVAFPETLAKAINNKSPDFLFRRTHPRHLPPTVNTSLAVTVDRKTSHRNDGNNVDVEAETVELAKNTMYYDSLIDRTGAYLRMLRLVISEGRR
jgi:flagellar basal-body rod protein FlgB